MNDLVTFQDALQLSEKYSKRHLLTGNGFSIACRPDIFVYKKLFEQADFSRLSASARHAFEALKTTDFERVIRALRDARRLVHLYSDAPEIQERMARDADGLREVLVQTIAQNHPEHPANLSPEEYAACREFLSHFERKYTLNYDLLLYWTLMRIKEEGGPTPDDGFRKPEDDYEASYVVWEPNHRAQNVWYLHGALHIFDSGTEVQKYTWVNTGIRLIEQIRQALEKEYYPLFVAEGSSAEKLARIKHSDYLAKAYRSFQEIGGALFIYGHSLADNDEHYLKLIERGRVSHVFVGVYDPGSESARFIERRANLLRANRGDRSPLDVTFYDAKTAHVWGK